MDNQQMWIKVIKKLPTWASGAISLVTAIIGFVLLLQGQRQLGIVILVIVGIAALLALGIYLAFARTSPLITGGKGVYRFEKYRSWALLGLALLIGIVIGLLLSDQNRAFVGGAF